MNKKQTKSTRKDKKRVLILSILFTVFALILVAVAVWEPKVSAELEAFLLLAALIAPVWAVAFWLHFLDVYFSLRRREKYDGVVKNSGISKESVALAGCCFLCAGGFLVSAIWYLIRSAEMSPIPVYFCFGMMSLSVLLWVIGGIHYWKQRLRSKYKDDVEADIEEKGVQRKNRTHLIPGLITIIVMLGLTVIFYDVIYHINYGMR